MKHTMKKAISIMMVLILLLGAFAGCGDAMYGDSETTPIANAGADPETNGDPDPDEEEKEFDPTRVFTLDSLEPLSKEKQEEVEAAWIAMGNIPLWWSWQYAVDNTINWHRAGNRYYGTYNDCIVFSWGGGKKLEIEIGAYKISYLNFGIRMYVYHDNTILTIEEAYERKWLSDEDILDIIDYNNELVAFTEANLVNKEEVFSFGDIEPLSRQKQEEVERAWIMKGEKSRIPWCYSDSREWFIYSGARYYGTYNDCIAFFWASNQYDPNHITVAGQKMEHLGKFRITVYKDGEFMDITVAYEKGLLSDEDIASIAQYHSKFSSYMYEEIKKFY